MIRKLAIACAFMIATLPGLLNAHSMPNSTVVVEATPTGLIAKVSIPLSELEVALGAPVSLEGPGPGRAAVETYVRTHISVTAADGKSWPLNQLQMEISNDNHPMLNLSLSFAGPPGARKPTLRYDAVNHLIASHYALVYHRVGGQLVPLGRLQSPATTLALP